jgi:starch-binding outer membrane protein, SusD/RagB family
MVTRNRFIAGLMLLSFAFVVSCDDYLDPGYDEYLDPSQVFTSHNYSLNYVRTMYSYLPSGYHNVAGAMEAAMTDDAKHSDETSLISVMTNGSMSAQLYPDGWTWYHYYSGIRRVHVFLENVDNAVFIDSDSYKRNPTINDNLRIQLRAEARFLRAFYYFELLKRYGDPTENRGVPIVPEISLSLDDEIDFERSSYDACVEYIVKDCDAAALILPNRQTSTEYGKASKAAALALKSRLLLYVASPLANSANDSEKWIAAANAAKVVMELPTYGLIPRTEATLDRMLGIFTKPNNNEVLFSSPVTQTNFFERNNYPPSFSGFGLTNPTQNLVDAFETLIGYPIDDPLSGYRDWDIFYRRDRRLDFFIGRNAGVLAGGQIEAFVGGKDGLNSRPGATKTGYYIRKFIDDVNADVLANRTSATRFWVHFRYAEMLLNYAEAMNMAFGPYEIPEGYTLSAYDALKMVRDRVGQPTPAYMRSLTSEQFFEKVKNERRIELCFEGHRFYDVRRWKEGEKYFNTPVYGMRIEKQTDNTLTYTPFVVEQRVFDSRMYVMPIPYDEILRSTKLTQNKNW